MGLQSPDRRVLLGELKRLFMGARFPRLMRLENARRLSGLHRYDTAEAVHIFKADIKIDPAGDVVPEPTLSPAGDTRAWRSSLVESSPPRRPQSPRRGDVAASADSLGSQGTERHGK